MKTETENKQTLKNLRVSEAKWAGLLLILVLYLIDIGVCFYKVQVPLYCQKIVVR